MSRQQDGPWARANTPNRRHVHQRLDTGATGGVEDALATYGIGSPGRKRVVGRLEGPRQMDDDIGTSHVRRQVVDTDIPVDPLCVGWVPLGPATGHPNDRADA